MNIKNKILLTLIAIIFAICLFNTNCFAFEVSNDYIGTIDLPNDVKDYYFIFAGIDHKGEGDGVIDWYCLFVSTKPIYYTHYRENGFTKDSYAFYTDGIILANTLISSSNMTQVRENIESVELNYSSTSTGFFNYSTTYDFINNNGLIYSYNNFDIVDLDSGDVLVSSNGYEFERGTQEGDISNNITGDNDTDSGNTTDSDDSGGILSSIKDGFENVVNFFKQLIEGITNIFKTMRMV